MYTLGDVIEKQSQDRLLAGLQSNKTLKNKLGITDEQKLAKKTFLLSAERMDHLLKYHHKINNYLFVIDKLRAINKFLYGDIYSWAGKVRNYALLPYDDDYLPYKQILKMSIYVDTVLINMHEKTKLNRDDYDKLYNCLQHMIPFRMGNGITENCLLDCLAIDHGKSFKYIPYNKKLNKGGDYKIVPLRH